MTEISKTQMQIFHSLRAAKQNQVYIEYDKNLAKKNSTFYWLKRLSREHKAGNISIDGLQLSSSATTCRVHYQHLPVQQRIPNINQYRYLYRQNLIKTRIQKQILQQ